MNLKPTSRLSPVVQAAKILLHGGRLLVVLVFFPFVWAHERTHYAAARPWRLETSELRVWTVEPTARIIYDLDETPWYAVRAVGLAPTVIGYIALGVIWFTVLRQWLPPTSVLEWVGLVYFFVGWLAYTSPSPSDVGQHLVRT